MSTALLEIEHLALVLNMDGAPRPILHDVSVVVHAGEAVGVVGESGCGKSMTLRAINRLLPDGARCDGAVRFKGKDVLGLRGAQLRDLRRRVATIWQDPRAHVNPVHRVGDFMCEGLRQSGIASAEATRRAVAVLAQVGIPDGERRLNQYPHELSGGLLQRAMIGAALLTEPDLLLADEPTTALDVTTQAEVVGILDELRRERGLAVVFVTHDLDLAAEMCDRITVMYAGMVLESGSADALRSTPWHPYTAALAAARPSVRHRVPRLPTIPGQPLAAFEVPGGCAFAPRCAFVEAACRERPISLETAGEGMVRCRRAHEIHPRLIEAAHV